jgi:hypothetical protein
MAAMVIAPAIIQGIGMKIAESILAGMTMFGNNLEKTIPGQIAKGGAGVLGGSAAAARTAGIGSMFLPGYGADKAKKLRNLNLAGAGGYASLGSMGGKARGFFNTPGYKSPIGPTPGPRRDPSTGQLVYPKGYTKEGYLPSQAMKGRGAGIAKGLGKIKGFMPGPAALAFGGVDAAVRMASGQDAGKALGGAASSVIGSTLGGILGQALIPIPGVGAALGGIAGGLIGDKVFSMLTGPTTEQQKAAQLQMQAAIQQKQAADLNKGGVDVGKAGGAFLFGDAKEVSLRIKELGLGADKGVKSFEALYKTDQDKQKAALTAANALNTEIERLRGLGRPNAEIAIKVRELQTTYNTAKINAEKSLTDLNKVWADLGPKTATTILNSFKNMPVGQVEAAIAERIRKAGFQKPVTGPVPPPNPSDAPKIGDSRARQGGGTEKWDGERWVRTSYAGSLGDAVSKEMKMKPPGSDLVVANSSETVIPAAGGYGMADFVSVLRSGFATMVSVYQQAQQKQDLALGAINKTLISNQLQTNAHLSMLETKFSTPRIGGLGGGSIGGGVDAVTPIAQQFGLQMTSGYRPGDSGYHGANRARDFSNGTGPTPQMMQFAQQMASSYGSTLKELIYTPLGFSIKNGQIVPPYAQGSHYNHVHVAYATGFPTLGFGSKDEALAWEKRATLGNVKVSSITARQGEFGGGGTTINGGLNVSVQAGEVRNPQELAIIVANEISKAMEFSDPLFT